MPARSAKNGCCIMAPPNTMVPQRSSEASPRSLHRRWSTWPGCPAGGERPGVILELGRSTNETVAAALELADRVGAVVEPGNSRISTPRVLAFQRAGRVSATLGEVKNRADVVVFWGADPVVSHPGRWERYSVEPRGRFIPDGRAGRTVVVVDEKHTATAEQADLFVEMDASRQFEALWVLRALVPEPPSMRLESASTPGIELPPVTNLPTSS